MISARLGSRLSLVLLLACTACGDGENCRDGVDNDVDGLTDCDDIECWCLAPCVDELVDESDVEYCETRADD